MTNDLDGHKDPKTPLFNFKWIKDANTNMQFVEPLITPLQVQGLNKKTLIIPITINGEKSSTQNLITP
jgi:hypothetical protein